MTKIERAKAAALARCCFGFFNDKQRFVDGLNWLAQHSPETALSPRQKWFLDGLLWQFRKQLAGRTEGFELPTERPDEAAYMKPKDRPIPAQASLLAAETQPSLLDAAPR